MDSLGEYIVKVFALIERGNKDSAILFPYQADLELPTSYAVCIGKSFQVEFG